MLKIKLIDENILFIIERIINKFTEVTQKP